MLTEQSQLVIGHPDISVCLGQSHFISVVPVELVNNVVTLLSHHITLIFFRSSNLYVLDKVITGGRQYELIMIAVSNT